MSKQYDLGSVIGPQGPTGPQGPMGPAFTYDDFTPAQLEGLTGPQGPKGDKGNTGDTGAAGATGATGARGATGPAGPAGPQGPQGVPGPAGPVGYPLVAHTNAELEAGDTDKVYVFVGTTGTYTSGHKYAYDGSAWVDLGEYSSAAVQTDKSMSVADAPGDAKVTGELFNTLYRNSFRVEADSSLWTHGYYSSSTGDTATTGSYNLAVLDPDVNGGFLSEDVKAISPGPGTKIAVYAFDGSGNWQGIWTGSGYVTNGTTGRLYVQSPISLALFPAGWKFKILAAYVDNTISVRTPEAAQTLGGKIGFCYSTDVADNIDDSLTQPGEAADAAAAGTAISNMGRAVFDGALPLRWEQGGWDSFGPVTSSTCIRTPFVSFGGNRLFRVRVDDGFTCEVWCDSDEGYSCDTFARDFYYYCGSSYDWSFALKKSDSSAVTPGDGVHLRVEEWQDPPVEDLGHGVYNIPVEFSCGTHFDISTGKYADWSNANGVAVSQPILIPKSGIKVTFNEKYKTMLQIGNRLLFVTKENDGLTPSEDELLSDLNTATTNNVRHSLYIPYVADTYVILRMARSVSSVDLHDYPDRFVVTAGGINDTGGKLMNLFPASMSQGSSASGPLTITDYDYTFSNSYAVTEPNITSVRTLASIVRLRDVKRIVCGPKHSLMATVYKQAAGGSWVQADSVFGLRPGYYGILSGVPVIDFEKYDFDGFAMVAVQCPLEATVSESDGWQASRYLGMGLLHEYEDVYADVFVEWKNNVRVEYERGLSPRIQENLHKLSNFTIPHTYAFKYSNIRKYCPYGFYQMWDVSPVWYNAGYTGNSVLQHISDKTLVTAAQNPNSRFYKHWWPEWFGYIQTDTPSVFTLENKDNIYVFTGATVTDASAPGGKWEQWYVYKYDESLGNWRKVRTSDGDDFQIAGNRGYGLTCNPFSALLLGLRENYPTGLLANQDLETLCKFDRIKDFDCTKEACLDMVRPGDWIVQAVTGAGHVMTAIEKVYVNGSLACINIAEGWAPFARMRPLCNPDYFIGVDKVVATRFLSIRRAIDDFYYLLRIKPEYIRNIDEVYSMRTDWTTGIVMCDRGTDGIYTPNARHVYLSIDESEGSISEITLCCESWDEDIPEVDDVDIDITGAPEENGLKVVDVKDYTSVPGCYTVEVNGEEQERFYKLTKTCTFVKLPNINIGDDALDDNEDGLPDGLTTMEIYYENFLFVIIRYTEPNPPSGQRAKTRNLLYTRENPQLEDMHVPGDATWVRLTVPTWMYASDGVSKCKFDYIRMVCKADFGESPATYSIRSDQSGRALYVSTEV